MQKKISVIILTYDSYQLKGGAVELVILSIFNQLYQDYEIILVDNHPHPNLSYEKILVGHEYKIICTGDNRPMGQAKNLGARFAEGDILVFMDDDTILCSRDAFSKIVSYSAEFSYGYGAKRFWTYPPGVFQQNREIFFRNLLAHNCDLLLESTFLPSGLDRLSGYRDLLEFTFPGNFGFIKNELFKEVGGFYDKFEMYGWDDDYLGYSLYKACPNGFKLLFEEIDVVHVNHPMGSGCGDIEMTKYRNFSLYKELLKADNVKNFNINVLFGIPDFADEEVLEKYHDTCL